MAYFWPQESAPLEILWIGWPSDQKLWGKWLEAAQEEVLTLLTCLEKHKIPVSLVVGQKEAVKKAEEKTASLQTLKLFQLTFGDLWLRDIAPVFLQTPEGIKAHCFCFNGWGGKYVLSGDEDFAPRLARKIGVPALLGSRDFICEGGAIEGDGAGSLFTTKQCLLNKNRNPHLEISDVEKHLKQSLGVERILWLEEGLLADHTDGHIDNLVRFVRPGLVVCQTPSGEMDPNTKVYDNIRRSLDKARDASGNPVEFAEIPSAGLVTEKIHPRQTEKILPASHMNMIITERVVIVPVYHEEFGKEAVKALSAVFEKQEVIGLPAFALLTGGGAFHCLSQHYWQSR